MEKRNLIVILILVVFILSIMYLIAYSSNFQNVIQGLAGGEAPAESCSQTCDTGGEDLNPGECSDEKPLYCPQNDAEGTCGVAIDNCDSCGCNPSQECDADGSCVAIGTGNNGGGGDDQDYCSGHWQCGTYKLCVDTDGELVNIPEDEETNCYEDDYENGDDCGICRESMDGDGLCASEYLADYGYTVMNSEYETCADNPDDCFGYQTGDCGVDQICGLFGVCEQQAQPVCDEDGTLAGSCSDSEEYGIPYYCDTDTLILIENCTECGCEEGLTCQEDGTCLENLDSQGGDDFSDDDNLNYCERVGGECDSVCGTDYYPLENNEEYSELHNSCTNIDSDYVCCYPYANDELNDCEYYGGSCFNECSGLYYYADVPYLDDECDFYTGGENSLCCLEYTDSQGSGDNTQEGEDESSLWESLFGSPDENNEDNYESSQYIKIGESFSLHRNYVFGAIILIVVAAFVVTTYRKPKKKSKRASKPKNL